MSKKHHRVCPWWLGYLLLFPLRRIRENPNRILKPYIRDGMTVLEPGSGMGYFTRDMARLVGPAGRVIALDIQPRMLAGLRRRLKRAGLLGRVELRLGRPDSLGIDDLKEKVDLAVAFHVVHEVPDAKRLFLELFKALKSGSRLLVAEPKHHVSERDFEDSLRAAREVGFAVEDHPKIGSNVTALLVKPA